MEPVRAIQACYRCGYGQATTRPGSLLKPSRQSYPDAHAGTFLPSDRCLCQPDDAKQGRSANLMSNALQRLRAHSLYGLPFSLLPPRTITERLRRDSLRERYRLLSWPVRIGLFGLAVIGYPIAVAEATVQNLRALRTKEPGIGVAEGLRMYGLALLRNVPPVEYVLYGFPDPARRSASSEYLYWTDTPALQRLNRLRGADNADVQDKARFAALCLAANLPHAVILAELRGGRQVDGTPLKELQRPELWVKPTTGSAGRGSRGWSFDGVDTYRSGSEVLTGEQWRAHLLASDCIVQERLTNHPELAPVARDVAVLRLTTVADRAGRVTLLGAGIGLPFGMQPGAAGSVACTLSLEEGRIIRALGRTNEPVEAHPDTGHGFEGFVMPQWQECVALVSRAHRDVFGRFATLGWDVVITPGGPLLLEANSGWNPIGLQYNFGPLGRSALAAVIADEFERAA